MRTRAITAMTLFAALVTVGACTSKDNANTTSGGDVGTTRTDTGMMAGMPMTHADSVRADSLRADSIKKGLRKP